MFYEIYHKLNYEWADPRTNVYPLISSPFKVLAIVGLYLWFCLKAGPHFMKNRKPFNLKTTLIVYNLIQVGLSIFFFRTVLLLWIYKYDFRCEPVDYSVNPENTYITFVGYLYFLSKISELLDTVFFVLRKKYSQVSTLHLYHHSIMVIFTWIGTKYYAGGHSSFVPLVNSLVHAVMYTYYLIAALGPKYRKYLTFKKQITQMQLIQFVIILIFNAQALPRECEYPKIINVLGIIEALVFLHMFSSFYIQTYYKRKNTKLVNGEKEKNLCEQKAD